MRHKLNSGQHVLYRTLCCFHTETLECPVQTVSLNQTGCWFLVMLTATFLTSNRSSSVVLTFLWSLSHSHRPNDFRSVYSAVRLQTVILHHTRLFWVPPVSTHGSEVFA